jgi:hypothetical protein
MSTISAGLSNSTSLVQTGDTTGNLVFQTNGTTTALTLDTNQNANFPANVTIVGTLIANIAGNGSTLTNINASNITSGTISNAYTTASASNGASTIISRDTNGSFAANIVTAVDVNSTNVAATSGAFTNVSGNGSALTGINASNVSSGTLDNARTTANSANGASTIVTRDSGGNFSANTITANIAGSGSGITAINASNISSGTINNAYTTGDTANSASTLVLRNSNGSFSAGAITGAFIIGDGSNLTSINASNISSGTLNNARTSAAFANGASTIVARDSNGSFAGNVVTATSGSFTNVSGNGATLTSINASSITLGTIDNARTTASDSNGASTIVARDATGGFTAGAITVASISGNGAALTGINASNISSGTISNARTTANSANGASTIVARDTNGSFTANAGTFTTLSGNLTGNVTLTTGTITTNAANATDITNKQYVDDKTSTALNFHTAVQAATTANLASTTGGTVTYNQPNGAGNGVGATITLSVALTTLDGYSLANTNRVIVKDESNQTYNGVYTWATGGTVLTRATDADTYGSGVNQLSLNDYFFVQNGTVNKGSAYVIDGPQGTITFGTSNITFAQFSSAQIYAAGTGLNLSNTTFSIANTIVTSGTYGDGSNVATFTVNAQGQLTAASNTAINASAITVGTLPNARTTAASANGASTIVARDTNGSFTANVVTAGSGSFTSVSGNGVALTAINASNISSGTIGNTYTTAASANGASTIVARDSGGNFAAGTITATTFSGAYSGNGAALTAINASNISAGTISNAYTTAASANGASTIVLRDTNGSFAGNVGTFTSVSGNYTSGSWTASVIGAQYGGTGSANLTADSVVVGNGASAVKLVAPGTNGNVLTSNGTSWVSTAAAGGGVTSITGTANQIIASSSTGAVTLSTPQAINTASSVQFGSFGVGTAASGTSGEIRATNNITAYYSSDERLKDNVTIIADALGKIAAIRGVEFDWNNLTEAEDGYFVRKHDVGVIAQEIEKVLPEVVATREDGFKAVKYDRIVPLLIEAIKELKAEVDALKAR